MSNFINNNCRTTSDKKTDETLTEFHKQYVRVSNQFKPLPSKYKIGFNNQWNNEINMIEFCTKYLTDISTKHNNDTLKFGVIEKCPMICKKINNTCSFNLIEQRDFISHSKINNNDNKNNDNHCLFIYNKKKNMNNSNLDGPICYATWQETYETKDDDGYIFQLLCIIEAQENNNNVTYIQNFIIKQLYEYYSRISNTERINIFSTTKKKGKGKIMHCLKKYGYNIFKQLGHSKKKISLDRITSEYGITGFIANKLQVPIQGWNSPTTEICTPYQSVQLNITDCNQWSLNGIGNDGYKIWFFFINTEMNNQSYELTNALIEYFKQHVGIDVCKFRLMQQEFFLNIPIFLSYNKNIMCYYYIQHGNSNLQKTSIVITGPNVYHMALSISTTYCTHINFGRPQQEANEFVNLLYEYKNRHKTVPINCKCNSFTIDTLLNRFKITKYQFALQQLYVKELRTKKFKDDDATVSKEWECIGNKTFKYKEKTNDGTVINKTRNIRLYQCPKCFRMVSSTVRKVHYNECAKINPMQCKFCSKIFYRKSNFERHINTVCSQTKAKQWGCECRKQFTSKWNRDRHQKKCNAHINKIINCMQIK